MVGPLFVAFIAGFAMFGVVRLWIPSRESTTAAAATAAIAVLIIVGLGFYYYRRWREESLRPAESSRTLFRVSDRRRRPTWDLRLAGDNLYYLGLLFTLMSLIVALVQLFVVSDPSDLKQRTYDLIGNFGIALSSTVAGIFGRILLHSLEDEKTTRHRDPASEISESTMALRRELQEAANAFSHFTRVTQSQAEQVKMHSERLIREFNERTSAVAERGLSEIMKAWRKSVQVITSDSNRLVKHVDKEVSSATARTKSTWRELAQDVATISESARRRLAFDADEMAKLLERLASVNHSLSALVSGLQAAERSAQSLGETAAESATGLEDRAADIVAAYDTLARGAKHYQEAGLAEYQDTVSRLMAKAGQRLERDGATLLESAGAVTEAAATEMKRIRDDAAEARRLGESAIRNSDQALAVIELAARTLEEPVPVGMHATAPPGSNAPVERMRKWSGQRVRTFQQVIREG